MGSALSANVLGAKELTVSRSPGTEYGRNHNSQFEQSPLELHEFPRRVERKYSSYGTNAVHLPLATVAFVATEPKKGLKSSSSCCGVTTNSADAEGLEAYSLSFGRQAEGQCDRGAAELLCVTAGSQHQPRCLARLSPALVHAPGVSKRGRGRRRRARIQGEKQSFTDCGQTSEAEHACERLSPASPVSVHMCLLRVAHC